MKQQSIAKAAQVLAALMLVLSIIMAVLSLYPVPSGQKASFVIIEDSFRLTQAEIRRQGIGSFRGGENISLSIEGTFSQPVNFTLLGYTGSHYSVLFTENINYSFIANADYYEASFSTRPSSEGEVNFSVSVEKTDILFPFSCINTLAKALFLFSLGSISLFLYVTSCQPSKLKKIDSFSSLLSKKASRRLLLLVFISMSVWLFLIAINSNSLATFEDWYTDHARHSYSSILFTRVGFSIFDTPLGRLASSDASYFKFVTWPQMPHFYPLGSVFLFLPFGLLLQNGAAQIPIFKMAICFFVLFAHISLYLFLRIFLGKTGSLPLKLLAIYPLYIVLIVYSANGMFDSVSLFFSLIGVIMYQKGKYDNFILLLAISISFKYQAAIFLLPLLLMGLIKIIQEKKISEIIGRRAIIISISLLFLSAFTGYQSVPFLFDTRPEFVMNGINAFSSHSQLSWASQSFAVIMTLILTLFYAFFLISKNRFLSLSSLFLLLPSFFLPYFQPWYLQFLFIYLLFPRKKAEMNFTLIWLLFMVIMLSFFGLAFSPISLIDNFKRSLGL